MPSILVRSWENYWVFVKRCIHFRVGAVWNLPVMICVKSVRLFVELTEHATHNAFPAVSAPENPSTDIAALTADAMTSANPSRLQWLQPTRQGEWMMSFINLAELWNTVNEINIGMFTTVDRRGNLTSRPLITQQIEAGGVMWFFSSLQPRQAEDLLRQPHANVSFCDNAELFYVSLSGKALLVRDRSCHARLWNPMARAWFPRGMNDSQLVLVQFPVAIVEYWDADAGSMVELQNEVDTAVGARQRAALR